MIIAAGGTGGHIYPGIAIAGEIKRRHPDAEILFVGTSRGLESRIVPKEGYPLELIQIGALKGVSTFERIKTLFQLPLSVVTARKLLKSFRPDLVAGVGGYSSGPVLLAAASRGVPTMVVEPNAMPGFTNRWLARLVDRAAVTFSESLPYFRGKGVVTGNPVRSRFGTLTRKVRGDALNVLIFGGSQGAHAINEAMAEALPLLAERQSGLRIVHQTGERDLDSIRKAYRDHGFEGADVRAFIDDMASQFEKADVLICRSGATTAAEVAAAGKAAIFIPFPFATDDHQLRNAEAFMRAGAGRLIVQRDLNAEALRRELFDLIDHPENIDTMERASASLGRPDAVERTVDLAMDLVRTRSSAAA